MREIINISLPAKMAVEVRKAVKKDGFASVSEFFRHLLRLWNTYKLADEFKKNQQEFRAGKGKILKSLKDLK